MLYLHKTNTRLALKLFRGEPAISGFDWNFSPISPLPTPHRHPFQRMCVRTSTTSYGSFILDMGRSPGFGSTLTDFRPIKTWSPFGSGLLVLNLASSRNSPDRSTKSTRLHLKCASAVCKHRVSGSLSLPSRGPFHLSFTVLCAIGH